MQTILLGIGLGDWSKEKSNRFVLVSGSSQEHRNHMGYFNRVSITGNGRHKCREECGDTDLLIIGSKMHLRLGNHREKLRSWRRHPSELGLVICLSKSWGCDAWDESWPSCCQCLWGTPGGGLPRLDPSAADEVVGHPWDMTFRNIKQQEGAGPFSFHCLPVSLLVPLMTEPNQEEVHLWSRVRRVNLELSVSTA